jgi:hypothetical protein
MGHLYANIFTDYREDRLLVSTPHIKGSVSAHSCLAALGRVISSCRPHTLTQKTGRIRSWGVTW